MTHFTDPVDAVKYVLGMPRDLDYPELVHPEPRADEPPVYDAITEAQNAEAMAAHNYGTGMETAYWLESANANAAIALAEATLALVEQQRLANLIALGIGRESREIREGVGL